MYRVTGKELDHLCDSGNLKTLDIALFTLCVGALISLLITLKTVAIADPYTHAAFVACALIALIAAAFFGVRGVLAWRSAAQALRKLKNAG